MQKVIDTDVELCKPWNKVACFEKETRLETWQYFMMRHIISRYVSRSGNQYAWGQRDFVTVKVSPKQRVGLEQCSRWEQLFSHLRFFLPELKNNWDKCFQRSSEQTMLGTPGNPVASSPVFPSPQRELTTAQGDRSDLMRTISQHSWAISVVSTEFLLYCSLCRKSTTDLAQQTIFLKRIIYGG